MNLCECGCGQLVKRRFVIGHWQRGKSTWNKGKTKEIDVRCRASSERMLKVNPMFNKETVEKAKIGQAEYFKNNEVYNKGKKLEELYGKEKADEIRIKIGKARDGKTYEEIFGKEEAEIQKEIRSKKSKIYMTGKTIIERLGIEKAETMRKKQVGNHLGKHQTVESKKKIRETLTKKYASGERKSANFGKTKETSESIKRQSEKMKGCKPWNKDLTIEDERVKKNVEGYKKFIREYGSPQKGRTKETHEYIRRRAETLKKILGSPEARLKKSVASIKVWEKLDEISREAKIKKMLKGLLVRPTSYEKRFKELCYVFNLPYKYVGNGDILIGYKNPDFINTNGQKIVCEIYTTGHLGNLKPLNYEEKRTKHFADYGYKVIFFTEKDLFIENWEEHCKQKIMEVESENKIHQTNSV